MASHTMLRRFGGAITASLQHSMHGSKIASTAHVQVSRVLGTTVANTGMSRYNLNHHHTQQLSFRSFSESSKTAATDEQTKEEKQQPEEEKVAEESQEPPKAAKGKNGEDTVYQEEEADKEEASHPEVEKPPKKKSRVQELEEEVRQLKKQLLSSLAEQENVRKIARNDIDAARQFAIKSFAKSLLDVADNFERALSHVPEEVKHDREKHPVLADLYEGIEMTQKNLFKAFEANGLIKFGEVGEVFDPQKHSAMFEFPDPTKEPGTVGQVVKSGYYINKRVLRPAEVGVVKKVD